jgi:predicted dehydrogenase
LSVIRLAILGFWHVHATDYAAEAQAHPGTEIVAAWDDDAGRGAAHAAELGVQFHEDLGDLLARSEVDGVIVTTATRTHHAVISAAAEAGKHIFTEKVLALTPKEARGIVDSVARNGVKLTVSLPRMAHGYTRAIQEVLASGRLGDVTQVRCRLAHDGAIGRRWLPDRFFDADAAGGGALVDLGCHPLYLTRTFLGGMPESVTAQYGSITGRGADDNSVAILHDRTGALGIAEASFVNPSSPFTIEIHGTDGSLLYGTPDPRLLVRDTTAAREATWDELPIPASGPSPFEQWIGHIVEGRTATENIALALDLTVLVDAANRSALSGAAVPIDPAA